VKGNDEIVESMLRGDVNADDNRNRPHIPKAAASPAFSKPTLLTTSSGVDSTVSVISIAVSGSGLVVEVVLINAVVGAIEETESCELSIDLRI
jgi:hypothetical protein